MKPSDGRVAILGAGPIGLEAALAAAEAGLDFTVFDAGPTVGHHVRLWGHVRLFTPWSMNVSDRVRRALHRAGVEPPDGDSLPTGHELYDRLLAPLAALPALRERVRLDTRVLSVGRQGLLKHEAIGSSDRARRPFRLLLRGPDGGEAVEQAQAVIDCTGSYGNPNRLGDGGISAPGEEAMGERVARHLPALNEQRALWAGRKILLSGSGHSAQTAAGELAELAREAPGTRVIWAIRNPAPDFGAVADDPLPARAALNDLALELARGASPAVEVRAGRVTEALAERDGRVAVRLRNGGGEEAVVDTVLALNGGVGDASIYRQLQVHECYATCGPMNLAAALLGEDGGDCLQQVGHGPETLANPEPGFFILGAKSYGHNSQFLLRIGWQQVSDVFDSLLLSGPVGVTASG